MASGNMIAVVANRLLSTICYLNEESATVSRYMEVDFRSIHHMKLILVLLTNLRVQ